MGQGSRRPQWVGKIGEQKTGKTFPGRMNLELSCSTVDQRLHLAKYWEGVPNKLASEHINRCIVLS